MKKPNTPVNRVPREALAPHQQQSWDRSMSLHGDTTFVEVMANAPEVYDWYTQDFYQKLFYSGRVDKRLVELVRLKFANLHGCASCNRGDRIAAIEAGFTEEQLDAISDYENGPFSEREKAALMLADVLALTNPYGELTPEIYARARQSLTDAEIVELGLIMAVLAGVSKMIFAYDLLERTPTCPFTAKKVAEAA
jgi:alkylhydroperoxidase family enzyme